MISLRNRRSGASFLYAIIMLMAVVLVGGSVLFAASSALGAQNSRRRTGQAYFNAKSAAKNLADGLLDQPVTVIADDGWRLAVPDESDNMQQLLKELIAFRLARAALDNQHITGTVEAAGKSLAELDCAFSDSIIPGRRFDFTARFTGHCEGKAYTLYAEYSCEAPETAAGIYTYTLVTYRQPD